MSTRDAEIQAHQSKRFDKQRRFWIRLLIAGMEKGEILLDTPVEETVDQMLVEVHGLVVLQMVKPSAKMRSYARDTINKMIDRILVSPAD